jgi:hypothetical protein
MAVDAVIARHARVEWPGWSDQNGRGSGQQCQTRGSKPDRHCVVGFLILCFCYIPKNWYKVQKFVENK